MKQILFLILISYCISSEAQVVNSYGHTPFTQRDNTTKTPANVTKLSGFDTLVNQDTGYIQFGFPNKYNMAFDLNVLTITGTVAGTAVLQGTTLATMPAPTSTSWKTLTGVTTYCAGCVGASATVTGSGTTNYQWHQPEASSDFANYQLRLILTGTATATYTGTCGYKN